MTRLDSTTCDFLYFARCQNARIKEIAEAECERKPQDFEKVFEKQQTALYNNCRKMLWLGMKIALPVGFGKGDQAYPWLGWDLSVDDWLDEIAGDALHQTNIPVGNIVEELNNWITDVWEYKESE